MPWTRARIPERCGLCGRVIAVGDPVRRIELARTVKRRCASCAGEPVPDVIADREPLAPLVALRRLGFLPLDEREPGQEG